MGKRQRAPPNTMHWGEHGIISAENALPKSNCGKQQTNKNWRHSTKVIDDKTKTEELSQTVTTQCNVSFKGHC